MKNIQCDLSSINVKCENCGSKKGIIEDSGPHKKILCENCGYYIKFLSKKECAKLKESNPNEILTSEQKIDKLIDKLKEQDYKIDKLTKMVMRVGIMINDHTFDRMELDND